MPYASVAELPDPVRARLSDKCQRAWRRAWNETYARTGDEGQAFRVANAAAKVCEASVAKVGRVVLSPLNDPAEPSLPSRDILDALDDAIAFTGRRIAKVETDGARVYRDELQALVMPGFVAALETYFLGLAVRLGAGRIAKAAPFDDVLDWAAEENRLRQVMRQPVEEMLTGGTRQAEAMLATVASTQLPHALRGSLSLGDYDLSIRDQIGRRIVAINEVTRARVEGIVAQGVERGLSPAKIARGTKEFDGIRSYVAQTYKNRARVIALTETANAYNLGQVQGYRAAGVEKVRIFDGDGCGWRSHDDPDGAAGSIRTLEEAEYQPTAHPNCQRSWAPYFEWEEQTYASAEGSARAPNAFDRPTATQDIITTPTGQYTGPLNVKRLDSVEQTDWRRELAEQAGFRNVDEFNAATEQRMASMFENAEPRMRVPQDALDSIVRDGRFKSQFETGSSRGMYDPVERALVEDDLWAIGKEVTAVPRSSRPIYGYIEEVDDVAGGMVEQYGEVVVRFKPEIRLRTTFTGSDSLGADMVPSPMVSPRAASIRPSHARNLLGNDKGINSNIYSRKNEALRAAGRDIPDADNAYFEAQFHGGVTLDDVSEVLVPLDGFQTVDDVVADVTLKALRDRGINVRGYTRDYHSNALTGEPYR